VHPADDLGDRGDHVADTSRSLASVSMARVSAERVSSSWRSSRLDLTHSGTATATAYPSPIAPASTNLDDALLAEAKHVTARTGRSLTAVVEDALRESLHRRHHSARRAVELPTFGEDGVRPGVDLDDKRGPADLMTDDVTRRDAAC